MNHKWAVEKEERQEKEESALINLTVVVRASGNIDNLY